MVSAGATMVALRAMRNAAGRRATRRAMAAMIATAARAMTRRVMGGLQGGARSLGRGAGLQLGEAGGGLLDVGGEVGELLHLADLDDLVLRRRAARRPLDGLLPRADLDHPVAA